MFHIPEGTSQRLRELANWHRICAAHAGSIWVWEARLRTAEALEREADLRAAQPAAVR